MCGEGGPRERAQLADVHGAAVQRARRLPIIIAGPVGQATRKGHNISVVKAAIPLSSKLLQEAGDEL